MKLTNSLAALPQHSLGFNGFLCGRLNALTDLLRTAVRASSNITLLLGGAVITVDIENRQWHLSQCST
ncbi:hypothetical protein Rleg9DRAFT_4984 [Rhizobium leguminosarum bv. trifolii WSM597]|uniref:Uncharacterized protein n=1 Tax=Rhizobium leguminosarum bv. trifolii WSM597 TaxID=754764 RepID=I9XAQ7_RHILT|nr:hypothetical protein Rleg9DRAFT_4984 [Rhizobium leguminosarum bv. trifolii WSM597]